MQARQTAHAWGIFMGFVLHYTDVAQAKAGESQ